MIIDLGINPFALGVEDIESVIEEVSVSEVNYFSAYSKVNSFVALDISVTSTGWLKYEDEGLICGTYTLDNIKVKSDDKSKSKLRLERRKAFKKFLKDLVGEGYIEYLFIEDTIGSCNQETFRDLIELNSIADDLKDDGIINVGTIVREDNKVWKKYMRRFASYKPSVVGLDDKRMIVECMTQLGLNNSDIMVAYDSTISNVQLTIDTIPQDIYDVFGLAVGVICRLFMSSKTEQLGYTLKDNILKGYNIKQCKTEEEALKYAEKYATEDLPMYTIDVTKSTKDLEKVFKSEVKEVGDNKTFIIKVATGKMGKVALKKNFKLDLDLYFLVVRKK